MVHCEEAPQVSSSVASGVGEGGSNPLPLEIEEQREQAGSHIIEGEPWVLRGGGP